MLLNRRVFGKHAMGSAFTSWLVFSPAASLLAEATVPLQPFSAQIARLGEALSALGSPFSAEERSDLQKALAMSDEGAAVEAIASVLDRKVLMVVTINPEARVALSRGAAQPTLVQAGWRSFLIKVNNQAAVTSPLLFRSPQGGPMGRLSSLAIEGVHDFTNGAVDAVEARARWIGLAPYLQPPMTATLSGLSLEYRILQLYSRDAGEREATLQADLGLGEQDLGFRSLLPVLFHCLPARVVSLHIVDEHGKSSTASLLIQDDVGRIYPAQGKREQPDLAFEQQIYRADGETLLLPEGDFHVSYGRGPEYLRKTVTLLVVASGTRLSIALERWIDPSAYGYYSGDTHIHAAGCSHYESPTEGVMPEVMKRQVAGEALDLGAVLNWGPGFEYQKQFFSGHTLPSALLSSADDHPVHHGHAQDEVPNEGFDRLPTDVSQPLLRYDLEVSGFPSSHCGHLVLLRLQQDLYPGARTIDHWPSWNLPILKWAKSQGAVTGYAHVGHGLVVDSTTLPNYLMPPFNSSGANEYLVDVTHPGVIDFISGCDLWPFAELNVWYHTLNCGFLTPFAGETDFPCLSDECVGGGRSYVRLGIGPPRGDLGYDAWLTALLRRDSYFGDGRAHIFGMAARPVESHEDPNRDGEVSLSREGRVIVTAHVCARLEPSPDDRLKGIRNSSPYTKPYWHLERARLEGSRRVPVELIVNGYPVARTEIVADGSVQSVELTCGIAQTSWAALRIYPSVHSNPLKINVAGKELRASRRSAAWCRQAVDICWAQKKPRIRASEQEAAARAYDHARRAYDVILRECVED